MSKNSIYINSSLILVVIILSSLTAWQVNIKFNLSKSISAKSEELKRSRSSQKHLEKLKSELELWEKKENALNRMIPEGEEQPLRLIKSIVRLGNEVGMKKIDFDVKSSLVTSGAGAGNGESTDESGEGGVKVLYFKMNCEGTFIQFLKFLNRLMNVERIVEVRGIKVERLK
ncbi:hypothetical protein EPO66_04120, partial [bacterium]